MAVKKSGLGKGLDSLIPKQTAAKHSTGAGAGTSGDVSAKDETKSAVKKEPPLNQEVKLKLTQIEPNRDQPRKSFDEQALAELADSIRQFGVIQPLIVQKKGDFYEIIAGERRWRAARMAGLKEIPVIIREFSDRQAVEISLIENIQRENLNPIEEAVAYKRLLNEFDLTQEEVADRVSKSRAAVTNSMRLLKLDDRVQQMVVEEKLSTGHARALLGIADAELQYQCAQEIFDRKLSVRDVERMVKVLSSKKKEKPKQDESQPQDFIYQDLEERMKALLGTKVSIDHRNQNRGRIVIDYYSNEELERLMYLFQSISDEKN
ncbi:MAG: ParB/RepB/Spo0J family partition protein [Clostridiales bacterium]|nr:ParB/RepB/Spo0J family partition protein [Clostridiales bacterium]